MPTFIVTRKLDGVEMTRYCSSQVVEQINADHYPLATFDHTEYVEGEVAPVAINPNDWHIHVGPFFDRFGAFKIPVLASADLVVQALIKDATVRKYIDLLGRRTEIEQMIGILQAKGFPVDATAILDVLPTNEERFNGE